MEMAQKREFVESAMQENGGSVHGNGASRGIVTWQEAEAAMIVAIEAERLCPDRERQWLSAAARSAWPSVLHDVFDVYGQEPAHTRRNLSPQEIALRDLMLHGSERREPVANAIPPQHRRLVAEAIKSTELDERTKWSHLWKLERDRLRQDGVRISFGVDALAKRYSRALGKVAERLQALGWSAP